MKRITVLGVIFLFVVLGLTSWVNATIIIINPAPDEVSVAADKLIYQSGESVKISVTFYNQNPEPLSLTGGFDLFSYTIDGIYTGTYFHIPPLGGGLIIRLPLIQPNDSYTWHSTYDLEEMQIYPLDAGWHSVVGKVSANELTGNNESTPHLFYVIPEPASAILIGAGLFFARLRHRQS